MKLFLLFVFFSFLLMDEIKKIEPIPRLGEKELTINLDMDKYFNFNTIRDTILTDFNIKDIINNAKKYSPTPVLNSDIVIMETSFGKVKFKLFPSIAPKHCLNFKKLCNSGFYDKTLFHRLIPNFMIQGGDILTRDADPNNDGTGNPGWTLDAEFNNIKHKKGILSMARGLDINSAGSQFFICFSDATHLDGKYTAFGELIDGHEVLDLMSNVISESKQIMKLSKNEIPKNQDVSNWIEYKINDKLIYFKVPIGINKKSYYNDIKNRISNKTRPHVPITIQKIRVVNNQDLN
tara:strand:- start:2826 stop:3701 length:876 start_codon:yes stop_codon:yes gene_type:complete